MHRFEGKVALVSGAEGSIFLPPRYSVLSLMNAAMPGMVKATRPRAGA